MLFFFANCFRNCTAIESWIIEKSGGRLKDAPPFIYPYSLGFARNIRETFARSLARDGIHWTVREGEFNSFAPSHLLVFSSTPTPSSSCCSPTGCDEYTLTREQLRQKEIKRLNSEVRVVAQPAGRCCGLCFAPFLRLRHRLHLSKRCPHLRLLPFRNTAWHSCLY
jgi:hypothetical protein